jgi:hypothetical protein
MFKFNAQNCLRVTCKYIQNAAIELLETYSREEVENFIPKSHQKLILDHLDISPKKYCIDTYSKKITFNGRGGYSKIYRSDIIQSIIHYDSKSVMSYNNQIYDIELISQLIDYKNNKENLNYPISIIKSRRNIQNKSLRLVACHILSEAKKSICNFASVLRCALLKKNIKYQLVMTDTDSLLLYFYQSINENNKNINFSEFIDKTLKEDEGFNALMDYSNYPKDHPLYSTEKQKYPHHFQNEFPNEKLETVISLGPKCYEVIKENKNKMRNRGFPQQFLEASQYSKGADLFKLSHYFNNCAVSLHRQATEFTSNRLTFKSDSINTVERKMIFMNNINSKYYLLDNGTAMIRDDNRLALLHQLNMETLKEKGLTYFCSDLHLKQCLELEQAMIESCPDLKERNSYMLNFILPALSKQLDTF